MRIATGLVANNPQRSNQTSLESFATPESKPRFLNLYSPILQMKWEMTFVRKMYQVVLGFKKSVEVSLLSVIAGKSVRLNVKRHKKTLTSTKGCHV